MYNMKRPPSHQSLSALLNETVRMMALIFSMQYVFIFTIFLFVPWMARCLPREKIGINLTTVQNSTVCFSQSSNESRIPKVSYLQVTKWVRRIHFIFQREIYQWMLAKKPTSDLISLPQSRVIQPAFKAANRNLL